MQFNSEKTCDQSESSIHERIQDLKKKIAFSNAQLHKLVADELKFGERIKELNRKGVKQLNNQLNQQAAIYLLEAQRNLQYAANCGLSIDRILIATTLKNLACAYQRQWELTICYDYMEALILNLSIQSEDSLICQMTQLAKDKNSIQYQKVSKAVNIKLKLGISYLQFSALSSQLGKHQEAKKIVFQSLQEFRKLTQICHSYELLSKGKTSILLNDIRKSIDLDSNETILDKMEVVSKGVHQIKEHVYFFSFDTTVIEKLSMGDIMQVNCTTVQEEHLQDGISWFVSQLGLTYVALYISCCFFALATQIRLSHPQGNNNHDNQIEVAKLHHLHSIQIASQYVLIQSNYLSHILKSFKNNFKIDILEDDVALLKDNQNIRIEEMDNNQQHKNLLEKKANDAQIQVSIVNQKIDKKLKNVIKLSILKQKSRKKSIASQFLSPRNKLFKHQIKQSNQLCINKNKAIQPNRNSSSNRSKNKKNLRVASRSSQKYNNFNHSNQYYANQKKKSNVNLKEGLLVKKQRNKKSIQKSKHKQAKRFQRSNSKFKIQTLKSLKKN